jgi:redox-sensitive bicupin YhaK (pirin superfamily)
MSRKQVQKQISEALINDGDMTLYRALPTNGKNSLGPFVFIDHYRHQSLRGIGDKPHPHAGIEVISYLLSGEVEHRDSLGFKDRLSAGEVQHISAGRGILHAEKPLSGRHGLQLWTSLPPNLKQSTPTYRSYRAANIPQKKLCNGFIRVIAGTVDGIAGVMQTASPTTLAHIHIHAGSSIVVTVDKTQELALYVMDGVLQSDDGTLLKSGALIELSLGPQVHITAPLESSVDVALLGGAPVQGDVLFSGPFVMNTPEQLSQAHHDYYSGKMGVLDGVPF